ncbi:MAG: HNH endonuclease [Clostridium sp.]|uniref:HNH endonuclease signature motif containing protein n=1 Tax=Clostridium sp. TaxID=1506 RepID=UPI0025B99B23|nr:HNH endonuclease signature motif containing protein [Clostridium sp.]MCE5221875.1 HNH endonuclease [Clostridium sp.]
MDGRPKGSKNKVLHIWNEEEKKYLKEITPGHHYKEIQELMNKKFNLEFNLNQIKGAIARYKLNTGLTGHFPKGHKPFNKGIKGLCFNGCEKTQFKKGNIPQNYRPIGSERINVDGYLEIKVADPNKWRLKQQVVWEEVNGEIPKGKVVIFGDGNKNNFNIDNLILVSRKQLLTLNRYKLIQSDADTTRTGVIIADVYLKIGELKKNNV